MIEYKGVRLSAFASELPELIVSSDEIENRLAPLYKRLNLPEGRLELMSGIKERRYWLPNTSPSDGAIRVAKKLLQQSNTAPEDVSCLLFCSVSRDFVEPATSTVVHRELGLSNHALNFDISNACLGLVSGILMLANMIELKQIKCGLAVCSENAGPLLDNTIEILNNDQSITRQSVKAHFASLTIGSAAAAVLLKSADFDPEGHKLMHAASYSDCSNNELCQGDVKGGGMLEGTSPLMQTDSQELLQQGVRVAAKMWDKLQKVSGWDASSPDLICTHQVGRFHRKLLYETLQLPLEKDFSSFSFLGNCGSASLPATCAIAQEKKLLQKGDKLLMLGIGSGINATGLTVEW